MPTDGAAHLAATKGSAMLQECVTKGLRRTLLVTAVVGISPIGAFAQGGFAVVATWDGIAACSGQPVSSPSPSFSVTAVPAGATELEFRMDDLDAPRFTHGGGKVKYAGQSRIASGAF